MPTSLPLSCLTMAPRLDMLELHCNRKPLGEMNLNGYSEQDILASRVPSPLRKTKTTTDCTNAQRANEITKMLSTLRAQLATVLKAKPAKEIASSAGVLTKSIFLWCIKSYKLLSRELDTHDNSFFIFNLIRFAHNKAKYIGCCSDHPWMTDWRFLQFGFKEVPQISW